MSRFATFPRSAWLIAASGLGAIVFAVVFVQMFAWHETDFDRDVIGAMARGAAPSRTIASAITLFLSAVAGALFGTVALLAILHGISSAFRRSSRRDLLRVIVTAYVTLIFVFASEYYVLSCWTDRQQALTVYWYYSRFSVRAGEIVREDRALNGLHQRFWSTADWPYAQTRSADAFTPSLWSRQFSAQEIERAAKGSQDEVVRFVPEARLPIFLDCLHFSVETITTLGYGDISPGTALAKISADIEALSGTTLFVLALGMLFGNWWSEAPVVPAPPAPAVREENE